MTDEVNTFMFEGHDTVATNISFCLYMLSKHPVQMKKVQKEVSDYTLAQTLAPGGPSEKFRNAKLPKKFYSKI